ncbi:bifunctional DNA-formamidopyrimidine glycosylase/DNA-(apurinic or apyrimidinic site) lyase [Salinisphaera orenii]|uniref:bifunctional DNA-formamidopyrimidine glycosylase/DNA-(apurinic or apyrimidinic site) lyase n=1 Tax=Salinisphaera orenii TaxID=856731 RepID=UPI000DBE6A47
MPELPEVETTRAGLAPHVVGQVVHTVVVRESRLRWPVTPTLAEDLPEQTLTALRRRGKYLLFDSAAGTVCVHLGMSGQMRVVPADLAPAVHDHVDVVLDNDTAIRFNDARRFGSIFWLPGETAASFSLLSALGPEPFDDVFDGDWLYQSACGRRAAVKSLIMDHRIVVGVGNIYASEALHQAGIHPRRPARRVGRARYAKLASAIRETLMAAIRAGGTTLRDYVGADGGRGYFQLDLAVYGRSGEPCPRGCGPIRAEIIAQRNTFFCPVCQR